MPSRDRSVARAPTRQSSAVLSRRFPGSTDYWVERYQKGGNSGPGSYSELAKFKARVLNGTWSALSAGNFIVGSLGVPLRISELMYNPVGGANYEFVTRGGHVVVARTRSCARDARGWGALAH